MGKASILIASILLLPVAAAAADAWEPPQGTEAEPWDAGGRRWAVSLGLDSASFEVVDATDYLLAEVEAQWRPAAIIEYITLPRTLFQMRSVALALPSASGKPPVAIPLPRLSYRLRFSLDLMEMERQTYPVEEGLRDPVRGVLLAATPVLELRGPRGGRLGIGAGVGFGSVRGEVALFDRSYVPGEGRPWFTVERVDAQGLSVPYFLYWGAEFRSGLALGVHVSGLSLTGDGNTYSLARYGLRAAWRF